ncbi:hypothetical protein [Mycobacteroides abscessus]|uniref:hypothetical protein n=1 Tax=Mycobacteroides abscessus TaxID=36809 RepID=UPI000AF3FFD3|nr:hypothetical protein [Mycobacteroides abscessus]
MDNPEMNRRSGFTVVDPDAALADAVRSGDRFRIDQDLWRLFMIEGVERSAAVGL